MATVDAEKASQVVGGAGGENPDHRRGSVLDPNVNPPDQVDERWETSKKEILAYYSYYVGNNGLNLFNFAPTQFQNLLSEAAGDSGVLYFMGANRTVNSIVLLSNGVSFAIQVVVFLIIGSYADFGTWRPNILIVLSILAYGISFGWLGVHTADKWQAAAGLYIVGLIGYQTCLTFWTAAFPGLARNTPEIRQKRLDCDEGRCTQEEYEFEDGMMRAKLSNVAFYIQSVTEVGILAIVVGILFAIHVERNNNWGLSVTIAFTTAIWVVVAIPWFIVEKRRPGMEPGMNIVIAGFWQLYTAITKIWKLRQSFYYLVGYFLLSDALNTTVTEVSTLQASVLEYSTLKTTYVLIVGISAQAIGIYAFWWVQKKYRVSTKKMFNVIAVFIVILAGWGFIGIFTQKFGFHNEWEFWAYQAYYGLCVCPWYSYSQIMVAEVTPRNHEFLFFSLFSISGKTSAFIGPLVSSAIIDASPTRNESTPFYFLLALSILSAGFMIFFIDIDKSKREQERFLEEEARLKEKRASISN